MKQIIEQLLEGALFSLKQSGVILPDITIDIRVDRTKDPIHGDFSSNIAMLLSKPCGMQPRKIAEALVNVLPVGKYLKQVEIAGPGFINFFVHSENLVQVIDTILAQGRQFGQSLLGQGQKILLEYVSANPTGPLHVGHGRGAAFGASLANILRTAGYEVRSEYYVNDAGRQMNILAASVWLRYLELLKQEIVFPANAYRGDYVCSIAQQLLTERGDAFVKNWSEITAQLPLDEPQGGDKEKYIDALIEKAQTLLGEANFEVIHHLALHSVLNDIKQDLTEFGVPYDVWFSERTLLQDGSITQGIEALSRAGYTYEEEGALWFKATKFGDEKDRVLIRANGQPTYFASDVAYHWNKYNRGFTRVIDIFGADHHGYVARVKAAVHALGHDEQALTVLFVQFAILYREGSRVQMSTRSGSFVTLRELREEVGNDAARFFYVLRKPEQHMDFDLDLAKSESNDNPVYYIQYAHARICSVFKQLQERGMNWDERLGLAQLDLLVEPAEVALITLLNRYMETIEMAAKMCEPHQLAYYLRELANGLHSYYNAVVLLCEPDALRGARLCLLAAVRQVLSNGLQLLGVSAPESM